ncbi:hypothetical protein BDM02DRAFT_3110817 [Thelephora ganbajun]|uniref:Uncharacterized protein n=1 Tax=Thelephora ganbajun TaxID=370292 RepID=A0ACB6ZP72_THEGA|nr:hypothetical protein BDM02DRAFT_3110817 [Thelephora ganbajun]
MNPSNVEQHSIDYILQFISPPSSLQAIPVHALSRAMMQRHHFLGIFPDTPHEYLSWPSNDDGKAGKEATDLLEQYYTYAHHHPYRTVYTSDGDYTYGHVALSCSGLSKDIRLVFQWDFSSESWKFHDLKTMPFPQGAKSSPQAVSPFSTQVMSTPVLVVGGGSPTSEEDNDDAYWNAYGADERSYERPAPASIKEPENEDAYWAQYSAIQGTADSTVPSPLPQDGVSKRPQFPLEDDPNPNDPYHQDIDLLTIPQTAIYPGRGPSPEHLTHLLSGLVGPEMSIPTPPTLEIPFSADREPEESTVSVVSDLISISPRSGHSRMPSDASSTSSRSSRKSLKVKIPVLERRGEDFYVQKIEVDQKPDHALTETIKGVYKLWKADRGDEIDKYQFLKVVQKAIAEF